MGTATKPTNSARGKEKKEMEFLEEETRPRFLFQSQAAYSPSISAEPETLIKTTTVTAALCFASSSFLLFSAFYFLASFQILNFLLVWTAVSLLLGPFAPASITGGDVSVGHGEILEEPADPDPETEQAEEPKKRSAGSRSRRSDAAAAPPPPAFTAVSSGSAGLRVTKKASEEEKRNSGDGVEEKAWNDGDFEILKKQIAKHPVGTPRRWEIIAEAFGERHGVESVIRTAKSLSERRPGTSDSFSQFLRQRKPLDKRVEDVISENPGDGSSENGGDVKGNFANGTSIWSSVEDIALLNALKAFPKETTMRWEKIEAAVPGKSKACCMKRVADLKRNFRSSKASDG